MNVIERRMCNVLKKQSVRGYSNCLIKKKKNKGDNNNTCKR